MIHAVLVLFSCGLWNMCLYAHKFHARMFVSFAIQQPDLVTSFMSQEFQAWYDSQAGPDEASIDTVADNVVSLAAEPPAWVSLSEIKRLTGKQRPGALQ